MRWRRFEKEASCSQYPPDGEVTFFNITVEYGGQKVRTATLSVMTPRSSRMCGVNLIFVAVLFFFFFFAQVSPKWTTAYVDDVCNNRAHIVDEVCCGGLSLFLPFLTSLDCDSQRLKVPTLCISMG